MREGVPNGTRASGDTDVPDRPDTGVPPGAGMIELAFRRARLYRLYLVGPLILIVGCLLVLLLFPNLPDAREGTPSPTLLAGAGVVVGALTAGVLAAGVRRIGVPRRAALAVAGGVVCVAFATFTFGPLAFFEATEDDVFDVPMDGWIQLGMIAAGVVSFLAYVAALRVLHASFLRRAGGGELGGRVRRATAVSVIVAGLSVAAAGSIGGSGSYLNVVLSSIAAGVVAATLLFAIASFALAFSSAADAAKAAGDVGIYSAVFGLCLAFVVVFHVLWIVYILALAAIWPLKTVTPK